MLLYIILKQVNFYLFILLSKFFQHYFIGYQMLFKIQPNQQE